jgi:hypothetical protein
MQILLSRSKAPVVGLPHSAAVVEWTLGPLQGQQLSRQPSRHIHTDQVQGLLAKKEGLASFSSS